MTIKTKYGSQINDEVFLKYIEKRLIGKIYRLLPMFEKHNPTLPKYHKSFMLELSGGEALLLDSYLFFELLVNLESILCIKDKETFKSKVFHCISICEKITQEVRKGNEEDGLIKDLDLKEQTIDENES